MTLSVRGGKHVRDFMAGAGASSIIEHAMTDDAQSRFDTNHVMGSRSAKDPYSRPSRHRSGVRDKVFDDNKGADGKATDPKTGKKISRDDDWDMGHKPGYEFRKHRESAQERDIPRKQFLDEHNNPDHYRPELPGSNRSHTGEDHSDQYFGP